MQRSIPEERAACKEKEAQDKHHFDRSIKDARRNYEESREEEKGLLTLRRKGMRVPSLKKKRKIEGEMMS